jgi:glycosyltransferase involved in cell wall biosynthesis
MPPTISAIICTHNRANYLKKAIRSLLEQTLQKSEYEIVVVDNASKDNTKEIINEFSDIKNLKYMYEPKLGLSQARNTGWKNAKGKYVAYLDDDAVASKNWLKKIVEIFEQDSRIGCVGGKVEPVWESERPTWLSDSMLGALTVLDWSPKPIILNKEQWFVGANFAVRRKLLKSIGGFRVNLGRVGDKLLSKEEVFLKEEIKKKKYLCLFSPDAKVKHHISESRLNKKWFLKRAFWNGVSSGLMEIDKNSVPVLKRIGRGLSTLARILVSPKELLSLVKQNDSNFQTKCSVYARVGHVFVLWGLVR